MYIKKWSATRSGASVRIKGVDEKGEPVTIKTDQIHGPDDRNDHPTAQDERGIYHNLI